MKQKWILRMKKWTLKMYFFKMEVVFDKKTVHIHRLFDKLLIDGVFCQSEAF